MRTRPLHPARHPAAAVLPLVAALACAPSEPAPGPGAGMAAAGLCPTSADSARLAIEDPSVARALAESDPDRLAWLWFLGYNAPVTGGGAKAWESLRSTGTVFLPDGSTPQPWNRPPPLPAAVVRQAAAMGLDTLAPFHDLDSNLQVDGLAVHDAFGGTTRYELLMNRPTFEYVLARGLYNIDGQVAAAGGEPVAFPADAFEIKTSWLWLGADSVRWAELDGQFYTANAFYEVVDSNGVATGTYQVGRAALTGMHIVSKALPQWVWTTFDNVNDTLYTDTTARPKLPRTAHVQELNAACRGVLASAGSVLANYELVGTQTSYTDDAGAATLLANPQIETAFQPASSCITCHSLSSYKPGEGYYDITVRGGGGLTYYTGVPPDVASQGYTPLDFAWSLKRASWKRSAPSEGGTP